MFKVCFIGAGSGAFTKKVLGDLIILPEIGECELMLFDIDPIRLEDARIMMESIRRTYKNEKVIIKATVDRREALDGAKYIVSAVLIGGGAGMVDRDFSIPKKFGLNQTDRKSVV